MIWYKSIGMVPYINRLNEKCHMIILKTQQKNTIQPLFQILNTLSKLGIEINCLNWKEYFLPKAAITPRMKCQTHPCCGQEQDMNASDYHSHLTEDSWLILNKGYE